VAVQSGAAKVDTSQVVNSLNKPIPSDPPVLYPVPSPNQAANSLQVARFVNFDQFPDQGPLGQGHQGGHEADHRHAARAAQADRTGNDFTLRDMTEMSNALGQTSKLMSVLLLAWR